VIIIVLITKKKYDLLIHTTVVTVNTILAWEKCTMLQGLARY